MSRIKQTIEFFVPLLILATVGCRPQPTTVEELGAGFRVEGTVKLDGRPLSAGTIKLVAVDEDWQLLEGIPADEGRIENGRYQMNASLGHKLVEIYGDDSVTIAERFNSQTELKVYVHHGTENIFPPFDVKSK